MAFEVAPSATSVQRIEAIENSKRALELRKSGHTLDEIAAALGFDNTARVRRLIKKALSEVLVEEVEDLRKIEAERLEEIWQALKLKMIDERGNVSLRVVSQMLAVSRERRKLLGMDTPIFVDRDPVDHGGKILELIEYDDSTQTADGVVSASSQGAQGQDEGGRPGRRDRIGQDVLRPDLGLQETDGEAGE